MIDAASPYSPPAYPTQQGDSSSPYQEAAPIDTEAKYEAIPSKSPVEDVSYSEKTISPYENIAPSSGKITSFTMNSLLLWLSLQLLQ